MGVEAARAASSPTAAAAAPRRRARRRGDTWGGLGNGTFWLSYATLTSLFNAGADATWFIANPPKGQAQ